MLRIFLIVLLAFLFGCQDPVPKGRILVLNDSQDRTHNILRVKALGRSFSLKPGERVLLPKGSFIIDFSRRYPEYTRRYTVKCPRKLENGIRIKLIDVHVNRIAGGCETVSASK